MNDFKLATPLVSIALATYNGGGFLSAQLESLLNQTYPNLEIIVSDDGSTDNTLSVLRDYAARDPRIAVFQNNGEKGVIGNFEYAIRQCNGDMIALCDQDDTWLPGKIEQLVKQIGGYSLIYHDSLLVDEAGNSLKTTAIGTPYTGNDPRVFLLKNVVSGHASLFKREIIPYVLPFPSALAHDWWLAAVAADNKGIKFHPEVLVYYRQHQDNTSDFLNKRLLNAQRSAWELYQTDITRFESFTRLKTYNQFFWEWYLLNLAKPRQWFCFRLFSLAYRNRKFLYRLHDKGWWSILFRCLGFFWGYLLKGIVDKKYRFREVAVDRRDSEVVRSGREMTGTID